MSSIAFIIIAVGSLLFFISVHFQGISKHSIGKAILIATWIKQVGGKRRLLIAFGQKKKMFDRHWQPYFTCSFIWLLLTQIELIEIFIDGILAVTDSLRPTWEVSIHWLLASLRYCRSLPCLLRLFSYRGGIFFDCLDLLKLSYWAGHSKMPTLILLGEILLVLAFLQWIALTTCYKVFLREHYPSVFTSQRYFGPYLIWQPGCFYFGLWREIRMVATRFGGFWLYTLSALFPNIFTSFWLFKCLFSPQKPQGEMENIPAIMDEVKSMFGLGPKPC